MLLRLLIGGVFCWVAYGDIKAIATDSKTTTLSGHLKALAGDSNLAHLFLNDPVLVAGERLPLAGNYLRLAIDGTGIVSSLANDSVAIADYQASPDVTHMRLVSTALGPLFSHLHDAARLVKSLHSNGFDLLNKGRFAKATSALVEVDAHRKQFLALANIGTLVLQNRQNQDWLLATQNLAEARGTGGILGSFATVQVTPDGFKLIQAGSDAYLDTVGPVVHKSLPIDSNAIWGMIDPADWRDLNASGHVPYAATQLSDSWRKLFGIRLHGVLFLGQGIAQDLVALAGPVTFQGHTLDASNTADYLAKGVYADFPDPKAKNGFVAGFMTALFQKLTTGHLHLPEFIGAVAKSKTGDELYAWSGTPGEQSWLTAKGLAGEVPTSIGNYVLATDINGGGNKLEAYLHQRQSLAFCPATRTSVFIDQISNEAPKSGLPAYASPRLDLPPGQSVVGSNLDLITVYLPIGANLLDFSLDNQPVAIGDAEDRGHEIVIFMVDSKPGQKRRIWLKYALPKTYLQHQTQPHLLTRASFNPVVTSTSAATCK